MKQKVFTWRENSDLSLEQQLEKIIESGYIIKLVVATMYRDEAVLSEAVIVCNDNTSNKTSEELDYEIHI